MNAVQKIMTTIISLFPSTKLKNFCLNVIGHEIDLNAKFSTNLVLGNSNLAIGSGSIVRPFNVFRDVNLLLGKNSKIGSWNWFSSAIALAKHPQYLPIFSIDESCGINSRNYFDCSGGISFGSFSDLAGVRSTFISHFIDTKISQQVCLGIEVGSYTMLSSNVTVMPGAKVGNKCLVASGTVLIHREYEDGYLIAGVPGKQKIMKDGTWFSRSLGHVSFIE